MYADCGEAAKTTNVNESNAKHAILFEAVALCLHLDTDRYSPHPPPFSTPTPQQSATQRDPASGPFEAAQRLRLDSGKRDLWLDSARTAPLIAWDCITQHSTARCLPAVHPN